jgi:predicted amidophosphoribosyltransferase
MELKKCKNCGAFINSTGDYCTACANALNYNKTILKGYFEDNTTNNFGSISSVSSNTGVSPNIVQTYMVENEYIDSNDLSSTSFASLPY